MSDQVTIRHTAALTKSVPVLGATTIQMDARFNAPIPAGALVCTLEVTIAASGNQTVDLRGALTTLFGDAAVFATVTRALIVHQSTSLAVDGVTVTGSHLNTAFGSTFSRNLKPGDYIAYGIGAGVAVANGSTDEIVLTNADAGDEAVVELVIIGVSV